MLVRMPTFIIVAVGFAGIVDHGVSRDARPRFIVGPSGAFGLRNVRFFPLAGFVVVVFVLAAHGSLRSVSPYLTGPRGRRSEDRSQRTHRWRRAVY